MQTIGKTTRLGNKDNDRLGNIMRIDKFTTKFQQALADAQSLAMQKHHAYLEPVHVLWALLEDNDSGPPVYLPEPVRLYNGYVLRCKTQSTRCLKYRVRAPNSILVATCKEPWH